MSTQNVNDPKENDYHLVSLHDRLICSRGQGGTAPGLDRTLTLILDISETIKGIQKFN